MGSKNTLNERDNSSAMEDIELVRILLKDFCEAELLNGAPAIVVRWVENDMCRRTALSLLLDCEETAAGLLRQSWIETIWSWRAKAQVDLEECRVRLWWRVHHLEKLY